MLKELEAILRELSNNENITLDKCNIQVVLVLVLVYKNIITKEEAKELEDAHFNI